MGATTNLEVIVAWGSEVLRREYVPASRASRIAIEGFEEHALEVRAGRLVIPPIAVGGARVHGGTHTFGVAGEAIAIEPGVHAWMTIGPLRVLARAVAPLDAPAPRRTSPDWGLALCVAGSGLMAAMMLTLFALRPPRSVDPHALSPVALAADFLTPSERSFSPNLLGREAPGPSIPETVAGVETAPRELRRAAAQHREVPTSDVASEGTGLERVAFAFQGLPLDVNALGIADSPFLPSRALGLETLGSIMGTQVGESFGFGGISLRGTGRGTGRDARHALIPRGEGGAGYGTTCGLPPSCQAGGIGRGGMGGFGLAHAEEGTSLSHRGRGSSVPDAIRALPIERIGEGLTEREVQRVLRRIRSRIQSCYSVAVDRRPDLEGRVTASFVVGPRGDVLRSHAAGLTGDVAACISDAVASARFPAPRNGLPVSVEAPFHFAAP